MKLTYELINAAKTPFGAWTRAQIEALGVAWPPTAGWQKGVVGREVSEEEYKLFCELASKRRSKPKEVRTGVPEQPTSMDTDAVIAWLNEKLEIERVARAEIEKQVSVLQFHLEALRKDVQEAYRGHVDQEQDGSPTPPSEGPWTPPW